MPMKKIIIAIAVIAVIGAGGYFLLKGDYKSPSLQNQSNSNLLPITTQNENTVNSKNFSFNPNLLTVKIGTAVTWTNQDSIPHQILSDPSGETFKSNILQNGQNFSFTFSAPGIYTYHCGIHPFMKGKIVVQ